MNGNRGEELSILYTDRGVTVTLHDDQGASLTAEFPKKAALRFLGMIRLDLPDVEERWTKRSSANDD